MTRCLYLVAVLCGGFNGVVVVRQMGPVYSPY